MADTAQVGVARDARRFDVLHAVNGDGSSMCDARTADELMLIEGADWATSDLTGARCRVCQVIVDGP